MAFVQNIGKSVTFYPGRYERIGGSAGLTAYPALIAQFALNQAGSSASLWVFPLSGRPYLIHGVLHRTTWLAKLTANPAFDSDGTSYFDWVGLG